MPLVVPNKNEDKKSFINRCMKNPTMVKEFSDGRQRYAVCLSLWRKRKKKK